LSASVVPVTYGSSRNGFDGILGSLARIRDNKRNRVANMAHLVARQDGVWRYVKDGVREPHRAWQKSEVFRLGPGEHKAHAGHCSRLRGVDLKTPMGVGRAQNGPMQCLARRNIGNISPKAAQQRIIFFS
jgi:hypothetical protein